MIPTTPYLIRAIYDWCSDQGFTPHILVDASVEGVEVPRHLVENGALVLNVQSSAVRDLELGNEWIMFSARFSGQPRNITIPVSAVRAVFARENGQGCAFEAPVELTPEETERALDEINEQLQHEQEQTKKPGTEGGGPAKVGKPHLKLV